MKVAILTLISFSFTIPASAMSPTGLIKGSGDAVYYHSNGKRYVFPNEKVFFTWYSDFSAVETISDSELAAIPIGANVTYKPGSRLLKITSDPRTYVVEGLKLRPIASETVAMALFGKDWSRAVDDLSEAFFVNYKQGDAINSVFDYVPSNNYNTIDSLFYVPLSAQQPQQVQEAPQQSSPTTTPIVDTNIIDPIVETPMPTKPETKIVYGLASPLSNGDFDAYMNILMLDKNGNARTDINENSPLSISGISYEVVFDPTDKANIIVKNAAWGLLPVTDDRKILYEGPFQKSGVINLDSPILAWPGHCSFQFVIRDGEPKANMFSVTGLTITPGSAHDGETIEL